MEEFKKEFEFTFKEQTIKVQMLGEVYCAVSGRDSKALIVAIDGAIYLRDTGKLLGFVNIKDITK